MARPNPSPPWTVDEIITTINASILVISGIALAVVTILKCMAPIRAHSSVLTLQIMATALLLLAGGYVLWRTAEDQCARLDDTLEDD